jgi:hypothetical protein
LVEAPRQHDGAASLWRRVLGRERSVQLELPLEGVRSARTSRWISNTRTFATSFGPQLGANLLMRVGVPMVAATTPAVIDLVAPEHSDELPANLLVGSALGGAWGAMVGAAIPLDGNGVRISRFQSAGRAAAGGVLLAPAVAMVSKLVVDRITDPILPDRRA